MTVFLLFFYGSWLQRLIDVSVASGKYKPPFLLIRNALKKGLFICLKVYLYDREISRATLEFDKKL